MTLLLLIVALAGVAVPTHSSSSTYGPGYQSFTMTSSGGHTSSWLIVLVSIVAVGMVLTDAVFILRRRSARTERETW